jgi:hypothetical protein
LFVLNTLDLGPIWDEGILHNTATAMDLLDAFVLILAFPIGVPGHIMSFDYYYPYCIYDLDLHRPSFDGA